MQVLTAFSWVPIQAHVSTREELSLEGIGPGRGIHRDGEALAERSRGKLGASFAVVRRRGPVIHPKI
jgi:hypothetical protein